ncbi:MAG: hypothetical protein WC907_05375 [Acholeplasmataceae bacterium]
MKINIKNILIFFIGLNFISLGVILTLRTNLGQGSWDAVNYSLSKLINIKIGFASMIVNGLLLAFISLYRKSLKYLNVVFTIFISGVLLNFWNDYIFKDFIISDLFFKYLYLVIGSLILPLGLSLVMHSTLPMMIFDELTNVVIEITKIDNFGLVRIGMEIGALLLALILGYFAGIGFGQVGIGSLLVSLTIGPLINYYLKLHKKILK